MMIIAQYVWSRHYKNGWSWADGVNKSGWSIGQTGMLQSHLVCEHFSFKLFCIRIFQNDGEETAYKFYSSSSDNQS